MGLVLIVSALTVANGLSGCFAAVANVNPDDKATILAAGISEAINTAVPGVVVMVVLLVVQALIKRRAKKAAPQSPPAS